MFQIQNLSGHETNLNFQFSNFSNVYIEFRVLNSTICQALISGKSNCFNNGTSTHSGLPFFQALKVSQANLPHFHNNFKAQAHQVKSHKILETPKATASFVQLFIFSHICFNISAQFVTNSISAKEGFSSNILSFSIISLASSAVSTPHSILFLFEIYLGARTAPAPIFNIILIASCNHCHISTHNTTKKSFILSIDVISNFLSFIFCNSSCEISNQSQILSFTKSNILSVIFMSNTQGIQILFISSLFA